MAARVTKAFDATVADLPRTHWVVEVFAVCPRCGREMSLGSAQGTGKAILVCGACQHVEHSTAEAGAVVGEVLTAAANIP